MTPSSSTQALDPKALEAAKAEAKTWGHATGGPALPAILAAYLAALPTEAPEPVAWESVAGVTRKRSQAERWEGQGYAVRPLYARPATVSSAVPVAAIIEECAKVAEKYFSGRSAAKAIRALIGVANG